MGPRRAILWVSFAVLLAVGIWGAGQGRTPSLSPSASLSPTASLSPSASPAAPPLLRPTRATVEFGILFPSRKAAERWGTREHLSDALTSRHCGPEDACERVRRAADVSIALTPANTWFFPTGERFAQATDTLSDGERARISKSEGLAIVRALGDPLPEGLPLRAAIALTIAFAEKVGGIVFDNVRDRYYSPERFATLACTEPLSGSIFHARHVDVVRDEERLLTVGLSRFGLPDLELLPERAEDAALLMATARALATGQGSARVRFFSEVLSPTVRLVPPHAGDPNDSMARVSLDRRPLGAGAAAALPDAWPMLEEAHALGGKVALLFPFEQGGTEEWMWVDLVRLGSECVGVLMDTPKVVRARARGDILARARGDAKGYQLLLGEKTLTWTSP